MAANVTEIYFLPTDDKRDTLSILADTQDIDQAKCVGLDGTYPTNAGDPCYGVSINAGIRPTEFGASEQQVYATVSRANIAVITVEPTVAVAVGDLLTPAAASGNVQVAAGTDYVVGQSLDSSDGSGTVSVPHYVRVALAK